jgi:YHS domain-containing protein
MTYRPITAAIDPTDAQKWKERPRRRSRGTLSWCVLLTLINVGVADAQESGTWKFPPAPDHINPEFDSEDPVALAAGAHVKTDCSINLKLNGKTYCFTTRMSMNFFEESPSSYLAPAQKFFDSSPAGQK